MNQLFKVDLTVSSATMKRMLVSLMLDIEAQQKQPGLSELDENRLWFAHEAVSDAIQCLKDAEIAALHERDKDPSAADHTPVICIPPGQIHDLLTLVRELGVVWFYRLEPRS